MLPFCFLIPHSIGRVFFTSDQPFGAAPGDPPDPVAFRQILVAKAQRGATLEWRFDGPRNGRTA